MAIYKTIKFENGDKVDILVPRLEDFSIVFQSQKIYNESVDDIKGNKLDVVPFFFRQLCLFNGEKKDLPFILKLSAEVYFKITQPMNEMIDKCIGL